MLPAKAKLELLTVSRRRNLPTNEKRKIKSTNTSFSHSTSGSRYISLSHSISGIEHSSPRVSKYDKFFPKSRVFDTFLWFFLFVAEEIENFLISVERVLLAISLFYTFVPNVREVKVLDTACFQNVFERFNCICSTVYLHISVFTYHFEEIYKHHCNIR